VYVPKAPDPEGRWALLLHGWNQAAADWDTRTTVETHAERLGWVLVAPDMGKSVYATQVYPDVAKAPPDEPGMPRMETLLGWAEGTLGLSADPAKRAVIGVSTGGRGAALLGERGAFGQVIALSGTYDLASLKPGTGEYKIHAVVFGERQAFAARWRNEDARGGAPRLGGAAEAPFVSWWLGHGGADPYVPVGQTRGYAARLQKAGVPDAQVKLFLEDRAQHDWATWDRWLARALPELTAP
jgi:S-formylglutathione hydrolase FrmB